MFSTLGDTISTLGDTISTLGDIMSTWGVLSMSGAYHEYIGDVQLGFSIEPERLLSTCSPHAS